MATQEASAPSPSVLLSAQSLVNDGQSPEQTHTPELSVHVEARTALVVQPRIVTRARTLSFIVVLLFWYFVVVDLSG